MHLRLFLGRALLAVVLAAIVASCADDGAPAPRIPTHIYWASRDTIFRMPINGGLAEVLYTGADGLTPVADLAIDPQTGRLFLLTWSSPNGFAGLLFRGTRDGSEALLPLLNNAQVPFCPAYEVRGLDAAAGRVFVQVRDRYCFDRWPVLVVNQDGSGLDTFLRVGAYGDRFDVNYDSTTNTLYSVGQHVIYRAPLVRNAQWQTPVEVDCVGFGIRSVIAQGRILWTHATPAVPTWHTGIASDNLDGSRFARIRTTSFTPYGLARDSRNGDFIVGDAQRNRLYRVSSRGVSPILDRGGTQPVWAVAIY